MPPKTRKTGLKPRRPSEKDFPTKEEIENHRRNLITEFSDVFSTKNDELKEMTGAPMKIHLQDNAKPFSISTCRSVPYAWRDEVKHNLEEMVSKGIITSVGDEQSPWCHPMVVVAKPKGGCRICVDLTKLNKYVERPVYPTKSPKEAVKNIKPNSLYFTTMDAKHGYWQVPLEEKSQNLTNFLTPWG